MFRSALSAAARPLSRRAYATAPPNTSSFVSRNMPYALGGLVLAGFGTSYLMAPNLSYDIAGDNHSTDPNHAHGHENADHPAPVEDKPAAKNAVAPIKAPFEGERPSALTKAEFSEYTLSEIKPYNHNSNIYTFKFDDENAISGGPITHLLMLRGEEGKVVDDKGKDIARPYTPISTPDTVGEISFLIKKYDTGKFTPYLASCKVGDKIGFKGPFPKFKYTPSKFEQGFAIAGGSGITPMWQLINHSVNDKSDSTKWTLLYSNVTEEDILLRKEWDALAAANPDRLKLVYTLDKPPAKWDGATGYITPELIKQHITAEGDKLKFFVCGPPPQVKAIAGDKDGGKQGPLGGALKELGLEAGQVFKF